MRDTEASEVTRTIDLTTPTSIPLVVGSRSHELRPATTVDVDALVDRVVADVGARAEGREILAISEVGIATIDEAAFTDAVEAYLDAAVALTPPSVTIVLGVVPTRSSIVLSVEDDAPPRLDPVLDWLFDESPRSGLLDRQAVGACRHLTRAIRKVGAMGGLAWIEEGVDGGGCLVAEIPTSTAPVIHSAPTRGLG